MAVGRLGFRTGISLDMRWHLGSSAARRCTGLTILWLDRSAGVLALNQRGERIGEFVAL